MKTLDAWPDLNWSFADAARMRDAAAPFTPSRAAERAYERQLASVAGQVRAILATTASPADAQRLLREYARTVEPWARQTSANMLAGVARKNDQAWRRMASRMGLDMRIFLTGDPVGRAVSERIEANVTLIRDIPGYAADQIAERIREGMITGRRAEAFADEVADIGYMALSRAKMIARTEVSKASTALTRGRAESVGSEGYIWRTARDGATRPSHGAMEGVFVLWSKPPRIDTMTGHAGEFPNCRCYPEPVIPKPDTRKTFAVCLPTREQEQASGVQPLVSHWERSPGSEAIRHVPGKALVNADKAAFDMNKLLKYALDYTSERGRHKARVFESALGIKKEHAELMRRRILSTLADLPAVREPSNAYGERFRVTVPVKGPNGRTVDVTTAWIYENLERARSNRPRLTSIHVT